MVGNTPSSYTTTVTYKQAANVQPFANTLVNMRMTGAQIKAVLEQQWQPAGSSRPFLRLGVSKGFTYNYDPATKKVTGMWLKGESVTASNTYSVTVNSFLSTGGDNFAAFADGTSKKDTGQTDLQGMVDYMAAFAKTAPLKVDSTQRAVGLTFPADAPAVYKAGDTVSFALSSLALTGAGDVQDSTVTVGVGNVTFGTFPVVNTVAPGATDDEAGTATVSFKLPVGILGGARLFKVTGDKTGTTVLVPARVAKTASSIATRVSTTRPVVKKTKVVLVLRVVTGGKRATGSVLVAAQGKLRSIRLVNGRAILKLAPFNFVGDKVVRIRYLGNGSTLVSRKVLTLQAVKKK
jgi:5'-nucleotidase